MRSEHEAAAHAPPPPPPSVLEHLGEEITSILWPVSLCMAVTVFLVRVLNPDGESSAISVYMASAVYDEGAHPDASWSEKFEGALLNSLVFVALVTAMTFGLVMLFKYRCYRLIFGYMGFAIMQILFLFTGLILLMLLEKARLHVDVISLVFLLWNFSVSFLMAPVDALRVPQSGWRVRAGVSVPLVRGL